MADKKPKITAKVFPTDTFANLDLSRNVRDPSGSTYNVDGLREEIKMDGGLKVRPLVHLIGGKFDCVVQGYRRITAVMQLHEREPNDRRWDQILCEVVEDLTPVEVLDLMLDHGNTKNLEPHEILIAAWKVLDADPKTGEAHLAVRLQGLLGQYWAVPSTKLGDPKQVADHYRGTTQNIKWGWRLPRIAQNVFLAIVKDRKSVGYRRREFRDLVNIFEDEMRKDVTASITKENPGPIFLKKWQEFLDSEATKSADGANRPKSIASMTKGEMTNVGDNSPSMLGKAYSQLFSRARDRSDMVLDQLNRFLARDVEPGIRENKNLLNTFTAIMEGKGDSVGFAPPTSAGVQPDEAAIAAS